MAQTQSPFVPSAISTPVAVSFERAPAAASPTAQIERGASKPLLPSSESFDIVPALHELINRLIAPVPGAAPLNGVQHVFPNQQSLEIHQLSNEVSSIRTRIRKARKVVNDLEEVERSVGDQEAEMRALRDRIEKQTAILRSLQQS